MQPAGRKNMKRVLMLVVIPILVSTLLRLALIFSYGNQLGFESDDSRYVRSARILEEEGRFVYYNPDEPTVYITPVYPMFLAAIFKIFGSGIIGLQSARVIQALLAGAGTYILFLTAKRLFNPAVGILSVFLASFYPPNISTPGYLLTETLFVVLFLWGIYYSFIFADNCSLKKAARWGLLWGLTILCRPTAALIPVIFFLWLLWVRRICLKNVLRYGITASIGFVLVMSPWWTRNYILFKEFIPLTQSSGNPLLQGTYVNYEKDVVSLTSPQKTERQLDKEEVALAVSRIRKGFSENPKRYLLWYTLGKTIRLWIYPFYWRVLAGVSINAVFAIHFFYILGFVGLLLAMARNFTMNFYTVMIIIYFNILFCIFYSFSRYAYPLMYLVTMYLAFLLYWTGTRGMRLIMEKRKSTKSP